jgi:ABC-type multidrug transport system fused ATPase/permease subunit
LRKRSIELSIYWFVVIIVCFVGNMVLVWGFGTASERMSRRIRDDAFHSLVRQEVSYFDKRSVGKLTSELAEDAARVQTFTGDPIRSFLLSMSSLITGIVLAFFVSIFTVASVSNRTFHCISNISILFLKIRTVHVAIGTFMSCFYSRYGMGHKLRNGEDDGHRRWRRERERGC